MGYSYSYNYNVSDFGEMGEILENLLGKMVTAVVVIALLSVLIAIANYIITSLACQRIGKRRGVSCPWLIWIPYARNWAIGALADEYEAHSERKGCFRIVLLVAKLAVIAATIAMYAVAFVQAFNMAGGVMGSVMAEEAPSVDMIISTFKMFFSVYGAGIIMMLITVIYAASRFVCIYKIYESLSPRMCILHFILSIVIPLYMPISLLCLSKRGYPFPKSAPQLPTADDWYVC